MFVNVKMSLSDLLGRDYTDRLVAMNAARGTMSEAEASELANGKVEFFPEEIQRRNSALLAKTGTQIIAPLMGTTDGAPTDSFRKAESKEAAPGGGCRNPGRGRTAGFCRKERALSRIARSQLSGIQTC